MRQQEAREIKPRIQPSNKQDFNLMFEAKKDKIQQILLSRNQELEDLLHIVSNELKEPLRAIGNLSSLIQEEYESRLGEQGQDLLNRISNATGRLHTLLDDIRKLSGARKLQAPDERVPAILIVHEALNNLAAVINDRQAVVETAEEMPWLKANKFWAVQALENLIANALIFTNKGRTPEIQILGYQAQRNNSYGAGIMVRDRGPGISSQYGTKVFQLFQRGVGREIEGNGAGLTIAREVAERHGGRLWYQPRQGGGSEFIITFGQEM